MGISLTLDYVDPELVAVLLGWPQGRRRAHDGPASQCPWTDEHTCDSVCGDFAGCKADRR